MEAAARGRGGWHTQTHAGMLAPRTSRRACLPIILQASGTSSCTSLWMLLEQSDSTDCVVLVQAGNIHKSLLTLSCVIRGLADNQVNRDIMNTTTNTAFDTGSLPLPMACSDGWMHSLCLPLATAVMHSCKLNSSERGPLVVESCSAVLTVPCGWLLCVGACRSTCHTGTLS